MQINHYEVDVTTRFAIDGPISPAGAAKAAEERASQSLVSDGRTVGDPVRSVRIISVAVEDTTVRPRMAGGGHR